jgi:hypothetical protein
MEEYPTPGATILDTIEWEAYKVSLRSDGLVQVVISPEQEVTAQRVQQIIEAIGKISGGKPVPVLVLPGEYTLPTEEGRLYIADPGNPYALAEAYVTHSLPQKLVGNFFLQFNKPGRPTRMFLKVEEAIEWLKTFLG